MSKRLIIAMFLAACICFLAAGASFVRSTGILRKRPKPHYLTEEEEALRPVYSQLSKKEKAVYEALYRGISEHKEKIPLPYDVDGETYSKLYCLVEKQENELFYVSPTYYSAEIVGESKIIYKCTEEETESMKLDLTVSERRALNMIKGAQSEQELARRIHDYIVKNCNYVLGEDDPLCSTVYGCLVGGKANCEGYAKTFSYLASRVGLKSVLITGVTDAGENHAWNQVCIGGKWYNIDVTWDDTDVEGDTRRAYFLSDDKEFGRTHTADSLYFEPFDCNDGSRDYYASNDLIANTSWDGEKILRRELLNGKDIIEIKFADITAYSEFKETVIENQRVFDIAMECSAEYEKQLQITLRENESLLSMMLRFSWE